jgi:hypothetical protein
VCVAQECECKGIIATTPIRLNLMLRLPPPPFLCKCSFHEGCGSIFASVHFARLGKIRVVLHFLLAHFSARRIGRKQAKGIRDWQRSRRVVAETTNGSGRWQNAESRTVQRAYVMLSYKYTYVND